MLLVLADLLQTAESQFPVLLQPDSLKAWHKDLVAYSRLFHENYHESEGHPDKPDYRKRLHDSAAACLFDRARAQDHES